MKSDLEIAQKAKLKPIAEIAAGLGLAEDDLYLYGKYKAKVQLSALDRLQDRPNGKYIDVSAITPTPLGEGKTVQTIGLGLGLTKLGRKAFVCLRQPSMGPTFGIKGGAAGGGHSQVVPMEEFNLHLTGDIHAVGCAHNLLAAMIDNHIEKGNQLGIDPLRLEWRRVVDVSDRALRQIVTGLGGSKNGIPRETGFDITVASEVMAILALTSGLQDLRQRMGRIVIGPAKDNRPVTADDLNAAGAMTVLMKDALMPTLMQTTENTPVFVHSGPFANIAHGNSSILADQLALKLGDYVVTESGFGADMGMEKFMDVKCRYSGLRPDAVVIVATVRALKMHSGRFTVVAGKRLDAGLLHEDLGAIRDGAGNLAKHIENVRAFGLNCVVAVNRFPTDTQAELDLVRELALEAGAAKAVVSEVHARGGEGGLELAQAVEEVANRPKQFDFLYPLETTVQQKIETIAQKMYGADGVDFTPDALREITWFEEHGCAHLPICMAKTHLSLSHDPKRKGRPTGFRVPVRNVHGAIGAGFLVAMCGDVIKMPGLPSTPGACKIDIDEEGRIVGLF